MPKLPVREDWGRYGNEPPCSHLLAIRDALETHGITIWAEHAVQPSGWVNAHCSVCHRTYEVRLQPRRDASGRPIEWSNQDDEPYHG